METHLDILAFVLYLLIGVVVTYGVGRSLYHNGSVFLARIFRHNLKLAVPVNKLLLTGYYLLNIGYLFVLLVQHMPVNSTAQLLEVLSTRVGIILVTLGGIHFFNLFLFLFISKKINL